MTIKTGRFLSSIAWAIALCFIYIPRLSAQKYNFTRFGIENGLNQSQALKITQDSRNYVWISTFDGINLYDGKNFTTLPNEPGSSANFSTTVYAAKDSSMWIGNFNHISRYKNGRFTSFYVKDGKPGWIYKLTIDGGGNVWATANAYLYILKNNHLEKVNITGPTDTIIGMAINNHGVLYAAVYNKGIYYFEHGQWHDANINEGPYKSDLIRGIAFDPSDDSKMYLASDVRLYQVQNGTMAPFLTDFLKGDNFHIFSLLAEKGSLWIGSSKGAYLWRNNQMEHFTEQNGFTNYSVLDIYRDKDGNVWLGSDGDGVFKYDENGFLIYDQSSGLTGPVMAIDKDKQGNTLIGTLGSGSFILNKGGAKRYLSPSDPAYNKTVYAIYTDSQGTTWLGNDYTGLWKKTTAGYKNICPDKNSSGSMIVKAIAEDSAHTIWVATNSGCYYVENDKLVRVSGTTGNYTSMLLFDGKIALAGRQTDITIIRGKKVILSPKVKFLKGLNVLALAAYKDYFYAGTSEKGIFVFTLNGRLVKNYSKETGLSSNSIYALKSDNNTLWAGTGRGINKFKINPRTGELTETDNPFGHVVVECNQGAITLTGGKVYVGTVKNILVSDTTSIKRFVEPPRTVISAVKTYLADDDGDKVRPGDTTANQVGLRLPYDNSHITFNFHGIQISEYKKIKFKYRLISEQENKGQMTSYEYVDYPSLLPGHYLFLVEAFIPGGPPGNTVTFSFDVLPAFYQTSWFRVVVVCFFLLLLIGIYKYKVYRDEKNRQIIEELRLAEQELVRRRTAEDFHDDLGNKLTRISVLTHILDDKVEHEEAEVKEIIGQIRSSALEIYGGTKDILWALNPENDYLEEVINFIAQFANELFSHTNVSFTMTDNIGALGEVKLPIGFGRNIILIAKELLNNILRHADALNVTLVITSNSDNIAKFEFKDDGSGFDAKQAKPGNGLKNIKNRAKKIYGEITVDTTPGNGTVVELKFQV